MATIPKEHVLCALSCSVVTNSLRPRTVDHQAPLSIEFSRQEYWRKVPFPPTGDLPDSGIKPTSLISCVGSGKH